MASTAASYAALVTVSLTVGYWAGTRWAVKAASSGRQSKSNGQERSSSGKKALGADSDSDASDASPVEDLASVKAGLLEDCKLMFVCLHSTSHATLACYKDLNKSNPAVGILFFHFISYVLTHVSFEALAALGKNRKYITTPSLTRHARYRQSKVTLRAENEEELDTLEAMARSLNLCARSIHDAGRTQIAAGSRTVVGIGPVYEKAVGDYGVKS
ncbi:PTH2-domain-containing protein [Sanghuangporus baumii]|uniref:peptidyl-tRNA hydrolase n=1 Tax=Sanghuangporus baumii TaxID=108892 RepID=A0A9Q5HST0_SANBA|nr:PTH2-domain-containing protein [Sanghuangporus baumii]